MAISQLSQATGLTTSLDSLTLNPFTGRVSVTGLTLTDRGQPEPLLHIPQMDARVRVWPLLTRHIHVVEATLVEPQIHAIRTEGKDFEVATFLTPFYVGEVFNRNGYTLTVDQADVRQGTVIIDDRGSTPPQTWIAREVDVEAQELLSAPLREASGSETDRPASGTVTATFQLQDAPATLRGRNIRLVPAQGTLTATFQDFSLPLLGPYFGVGHTGSSDHPVLEGGTLKADLRLRYGPDQAPTLDGVVTMDQVAVRHPGQRDPYLTAPQLTLAVEEMRGGTAAFTVSRVTLTGAPTWIDARVSPPIKLRLKTATLEAESVAWPTKDPTWMRFLAYLPEGGKLKARGPVAWNPFEADLRIALRHADLGRYQRFLPITAPVPLSGRADADFRLVARGGDRVTASGRGEFSVRGLEVGPADARILLAERADAIAVDIAWPGRLAVRCLRFRKPIAILEREEDGTFPMRDLIATTKPAAPTSRRPH
ncbi:MAG: AsmA family protein, partial [Nitrospirales bacterium]